MIGAIIAAVMGGFGRAFDLIAPIVVKLAPWILVGVLGAVLWHHVPRIGPAAQLQKIQADREIWKSAAVAWEGHARGWQASFERAEDLRKKETQAAGDAVAAQAQQCRAEVAAARSSARVIERIVTKESAYDQNRCPIRSTVDAGSLRDALAPRP